MMIRRNSVTRPCLIGSFALVLACTDASVRQDPEAKGDPAESGANEAVPGGAAAEPAAPSSLPDARMLLQKSVDAVGGKARLEAIRSIHYTGQIKIAGQNIAGDLAIWWQDGEFYMETTMVGIGKIRAGKKDQKVWSEDPILGLRSLDGKESEQAQWQSALFLAADWDRYFDRVETVGQREVDGKRIYDVELVSGSGDAVTMGFDAESGLQVAMEFSQVSPMGDMPVKIVMEDYRDVDGLKVAFRQVTDAKLATMSQEITQIEFNGRVDTTTFAMPSAPSGGAATPLPGPIGGGKPGTTPATAGPAKPTAMMPFDGDGKPGKAVPAKR